MKRKIPLMIITILLLQVLLPVLTIIWESGFTIKSIAVEATVNEITWIYELNNNEAINVKLKDKNNLGTELTIPSTIDGYTVTSIGNYAFFNYKSLESITIPEDVTTIGEYAFSSCSSLESINFSEGSEGSELTSIGRNAFDGCSSLESITIPNSVTTIGQSAFYQCSKLTSIIFLEESQLTSIGRSAFDRCSKLTSITIPDSVTSIDGSAFSNCSMLTNISVEEGNKYYSSENGILFNEDTTSIIKYPVGKGDTTYEIPNSVTSIGDYAFEDNSRLTNITIPNSVTSIGLNVFDGCISLTSISVEEGNKYYSSENGILFNEDTTSIIRYPVGKAGTTYIIPEGVTSIGENAFYGCSKLTSITIPEGVTSIGKYAFGYCSNLTNITIPEGVTTIGSLAFRYCSKLTSITIPERVKSIGLHAFDECSSLKSITIPNSVTSIGNYAFNGCRELKIYCKSNSIAKTYAENNIISFETDDYGPTVTSIEKNTNESTGEIVVTVNAVDELSGLAEKPYSFDGGTTWQKEPEETYTENTENIQIQVRDNLGNIATQTINIRNLTEIEITAEPKKEYIEGQDFDPAGMKITAKYDNGTTKEVTDYTVTGGNNLAAGTQEITVTYGGKTAKVNVTVIKKGDANGDNVINFNDILAINKHRLKKSSLEGIYLKAADVTGDKKVDFMDILQVNKYRLGKINSL